MEGSITNVTLRDGQVEKQIFVEAAFIINDFSL
jgi:hypothetical protein